MFRRNLEERVWAGLADSPVVFVQGPRQCGKSTLVRSLAERHTGARSISLDDPAQLAAARADPTGFIAGFDDNVILDEVQAAPELFSAIRRAVGLDRRSGRYLLTGSAHSLVVLEMARALVGRVDLVTLHGLSQGEIEGRPDGFVDWAFSGAGTPGDLDPATDLAARIFAGGFPEAVSRRSAKRRSAWFEAYVSTLLQRDVRVLAQVDALAALPHLLRVCASRVAGLLNFAELARTPALSQTSLKRYFTLLEAVFLVHRVTAWHANLGKRLVKRPKLFVRDSGLACHLHGVDAASWMVPATRRGPLVENFVCGELERQLGWSSVRTRLLHYRSHAGEEVDFVLEDGRGRIVGVEVRAATTPGTSDVAGLKALRATLGQRFLRGVLLHGGAETVSYGERIHALPISALWSIVGLATRGPRIARRKR